MAPKRRPATHPNFSVQIYKYPDFPIPSVKILGFFVLFCSEIQKNKMAMTWLWWKWAWSAEAKFATGRNSRQIFWLKSRSSASDRLWSDGKDKKTTHRQKWHEKNTYELVWQFKTFHVADWKKETTNGRLFGWVISFLAYSTMILIFFSLDPDFFCRSDPFFISVEWQVCNTWHSRPKYLREKASLDSVKRLLKTFVFKSWKSWHHS